MGGTHENGFRNAILKGYKNWGELAGNKKAQELTIDDIFTETAFIISIFLKNPEFQGQTKEKLVNNNITKDLAIVLRDPFDYWLSSDPNRSNYLLELSINKLLNRIQENKISEVILALSTTIEGQTTTHVIADKLASFNNLTVTRLAQGIPIGGEVHYLDENTLNTAFQSRKKIM